jgi:hypothetical protein
MPTTRELSGPAWVARFPDAGTTDALANAFRPGCEAFIAAMREAGATVTVNSTRRPKERAYLMHYAWRIHMKTLNPQNVPAMAGVGIEWQHRTAGGAVDLTKSRQAASAMVAAYHIAFQPALNSRHVEGLAIDMTIRWSGTIRIKASDGTERTITGAPRDGGNITLRKVGKSYGVTKHPTDPPHWSTDGR